MSSAIRSMSAALIVPVVMVCATTVAVHTAHAAPFGLPDTGSSGSSGSSAAPEPGQHLIESMGDGRRAFAIVWNFPSAPDRTMTYVVQTYPTTGSPCVQAPTKEFFFRIDVPAGGPARTRIDVLSFQCASIDARQSWETRVLTPRGTEVMYTTLAVKSTDSNELTWRQAPEVSGTPPQFFIGKIDNGLSVDVRPR
ncbi:hypothetical protein [Rhodococcoides kyotonense]|nr:hypothetical protein [Rhodococcus kyotonensis]